MTKVITSFQNPLIKNILLLTEKPRERKEQNLIVIEGSREIRLAIASGSELATLVVCPEMASSDILKELSETAPAPPEIIEVPTAVFNRLAYRKDHEGLIALAVPHMLSLDDLHLRANPLILVLETVEKPGNLGALLRTADAAGLDAVIICDPQTDLYNPNTIRSSLGCIFTMQTVSTSSQDAISFLKSRKIRILGTALTAENFYHNADMKMPSAIVMGSEAFGLSRLWLEQSDELIKIPMNGKVDSMNVSASAAVVVFEALRQRGFHY
jgi:TrmH family RNA methyltransferase